MLVWKSSARHMRRVAGGLLLMALVGFTGSGAEPQGAAAASESLFVSSPFTAAGLFTGGIEGPACDARGMVYAVNFGREGTIGQVTPAGQCSLFVQLPSGSTGNGIRFDSKGQMLVADYSGHNLLQVDMATRQVTVRAHEARMSQPNDIAIGSDDRVYASDPNWGKNTGQLWRIDPDNTVTLLEGGMGTTNGIEVGPGNAVLYVGESAQRQIWAYDLSPAGAISNKRLLITFADGGMDGMRCDVDGNLYVTRYGKGVVLKVSPAGAVVQQVALHGTNPSNLTFGGPDGRTCYVTLADTRQIESFRVDQPGLSWQLQQAQSTGVAPARWGEIKTKGN